MNNVTTTTLFSKPLSGLYLISFLSGFSMGIFNPLISILMGQQGINQIVIGANSSLYYLIIALFAPLAGKLIRDYGIRPIVIIGILLTTITTSVFPHTDNLTLWFIFRAFMGLGVCFYMVAGQTGLNVYANDQRRGTIVALHGSAFGIGFMISPMIGTLLYSYFPKLAFIYGSMTIFTGIFAVLYLLPNQYIQYHYSLSLKLLKRISIPLHGAFIYGALEGILVTLLPILLLRQSMSIALLGLPLTLFMIASGVGMIPVSYFGDKVGRHSILFISSIVGLLTLLAMSTVNHPHIVIISSIFLGLSLGTFFPITLAMIGSQLSKSEMHTGSSLFTASFSYGCAAGPLFAAIFMSAFGDRHIFSLIIILLVLLLIRMIPKHLNIKRVATNEQG